MLQNNRARILPKQNKNKGGESMKKEKVLDLLNQMTLEEKIGQLVQITGETFLMDNVDTTTGPLKDLELSNEMLYHVGSILNAVGSEKIRKIQEEYLSKNRLKIPLLFMADVINGYRTVFPIPLAQGCSWSEKVIYDCTKVSIKEAGVSRSQCEFFTHGRFSSRPKMGKSHGICRRRRSLFRKSIC